MLELGDFLLHLACVARVHVNGSLEPGQLCLQMRSELVFVLVLICIHLLDLGSDLPDSVFVGLEILMLLRLELLLDGARLRL